MGFHAVATAIATVVMVGCGGDASGPSKEEKDLAAIREATARFRNVETAIAAGYVNTRVCVTSAMEGRPASEGDMGIHFLNFAAAGIVPGPPPIRGTIASVEPTNPPTLLYEPQSDGSLQLVGLEYLVFASAWRAAGKTAPPQLLGRNLDYMEDNPATAVDEAHGFEPHYEAHLWTERTNPRGIFSTTNPSVSCKHAHTQNASGSGHSHVAPEER